MFRNKRSKNALHVYNVSPILEKNRISKEIEAERNEDQDKESDVKLDYAEKD